MEETTILEALRQAFPGAVLEAGLTRGEAAVVIRPEALKDIAVFLRGDPFRMRLLLDLTCVDYPGRSPRFEMVYHLLALETKARLRIKAALPGTSPEIASLTEWWKNAGWLEREVFDLFGIRFIGHPDLRRLLLYESFEGHPLRKDYPLRKRQPRILPRPEGGAL